MMELSEPESPVIYEIGHRLLAAYVVYEGDSLTYVQYRHLAQAGMSADELHVSAVKNLAEISEGQVEVRSYGNIYAVIMGGTFEASLVLLDEFWSEWCSHLAPNGYVVAIPARDILAFGDASSAEAINELNQVCQRTYGEVDHPLTNTLYRREGSTWTPLHG